MHKTSKQIAILLLIIALGVAGWMAWKRDRRGSPIITAGPVSLLVGEARAAEPPAGGVPAVDPAPAGKRSREEEARELLKAADVPIEFYGRMVDQDGAAMGDVLVSYSVSRPGELVNERLVRQVDEKATVRSGTDGRFTIRSHGFLLSIEKMEKEGYEAAKEQVHSFSYSGSPRRHQPDAKAPVVLLMKNVAVLRPKTISDEVIKIAWNAGPVRIPVGVEGAAFVIVPKRDRPPGAVRGFDWSADISMEGGEISWIRPGGLAIAPRDGYQKSFQFRGGKNDVNWSGGVQKKFVFKTDSGLYGSVDLMLYVNHDDDGPGALIKVILNHTGARNLE